MGVYFSISILIVLLVLSCFYFFKEKINSVEKKYYSAIIIVTVIGLLLEITTFFMFKMGFDVNSLIYILLAKLTFCYYIIWDYLYSKYMISLGTNTNTKTNILNFFTIIIIVLIFLSKITFSKYNSVIVPKGDALNAT